jgi:YVTN family beta-propeller protein
MKYLFVFITAFVLSSCQRAFITQGNALIVNGGDNTLQVMDIENLEIIRQKKLTADSGYFAHHVGLSANKSFLSVAFPQYDFSNGHEGLHDIERPGKALVLSTKKKGKIMWIDVPQANYNAVVSPDESELWTAGYNHSGRVYIYDLDSGKLKNTLITESDPSEILFSKDGKYAVLVCGETSFMTVIDVETQQKIKDIKVDPNPSNVWLGFDNTVFVQNSLRKSLNIIDLNIMKVTDFIDFDFNPGFASYNPVTEELWVVSETDSAIYYYKKPEKGEWTKTGKLKSETPFYTFTFYDAYTHVFCVSRANNAVSVINTLTKEEIKTISTGKKPNGIVVWE